MAFKRHCNNWRICGFVINNENRDLEIFAGIHKQSD